MVVPELEGGEMVVELNCVEASEASERRVTPIEVSGCNILGGFGFVLLPLSMRSLQVYRL